MMVTSTFQNNLLLTRPTRGMLSPSLTNVISSSHSIHGLNYIQMGLHKLSYNILKDQLAVTYGLVCPYPICPYPIATES